MGYININGKSYHGNSVVITNSKVIIDGNDQTPDAKEINISIESNINTLKVDNCNMINIGGSCGKIKSQNGDIKIQGNVDGDIKTVNGNINCGNISGNVKTVNGNIKQIKL